jgi:hypothetical protein
MADNHHEQADCELDDALAKYARVAPRAGLEERILANLRAEQARVPNHAGWRWRVAIVLAAVVVAALVVGWRPGKSSRPLMVKRPPTSAPGPNEPQPRVAVNDGAKQLHAAGQVSKLAATHRSPRPTVVATVNPKLDQFPSPQPLSEQEEILASYVAQFHEQAVLIARVANEELQRDRAELIDKAQGPSGSAGRGDQETTNR